MGKAEGGRRNGEIVLSPHRRDVETLKNEEASRKGAKAQRTHERTFHAKPQDRDATSKSGQRNRGFPSHIFDFYSLDRTYDTPSLFRILCVFAPMREPPHPALALALALSQGIHYRISI